MVSIRTRFAPSPTGFLHVGGLRTALYNYLFAKKHNGQFILRIEDTDQTRIVPGAIENLIETLHWAGIEFDEGPNKGGPYGPYIQSQRLELYRKHAQELIEKGYAYYCFCSPERLEKMREEQIKLKQQPRYDGTCRRLSQEEVKKKLDEGIPKTIRMKIPEWGELTFHDLIRGDVTINFKTLDDQIILKSDGFPTYHLAVVVDDHYMKISHVIRGEEWLPSTPKHILLYEYLNWKKPQFAHLPLLLNPDRTKLSKRQGDVAVEDYRAKGYLPEAIVNFIALLGWNPGDEREFFKLDELINEFSLERVNKAGAIFDIKKLNWMNSHYIKNSDLDRITQLAIPFLKEKGYDVSNFQKVKIIVEAVRTHLEYLAQIVDYVDIFFTEIVEIENGEAREILKLDTSKTVLEKFIQKLQNLDGEIDREKFKQLMKEIQNETSIKGKNLFMPIRIALTGKTHGPELPLLVEYFGKEKIKQRLEKFISL
ncbi:glutamate--tRNA ligase [Candidatus Kryptonium thompsonii]|uniref:glutamate--tRNA ligase n=2 Tax=Candidatus Kryptonium thompsonii TaxID=1633631 RepID=UPI00063EC243|nr:glutamate--tRNA ligase [Candidatus Kryptonium thompsoni]